MGEWYGDDGRPEGAVQDGGEEETPKAGGKKDGKGTKTKTKMGNGKGDGKREERTKDNQKTKKRRGLGLKDETEYVMSEGERFVFAAASAGEVLLRIGVRANAREQYRRRQRQRATNSYRHRSMTSGFWSDFDGDGESEMGGPPTTVTSDSSFNGDCDEDEREQGMEGERVYQIDELAEEMDDDALERMGHEAAEVCRGLGGTLEAVGHLVEACFSEEIIKAKSVSFPTHPRSPTLSYLPSSLVLFSCLQEIVVTDACCALSNL